MFTRKQVEQAVYGSIKEFNEQVDDQQRLELAGDTVLMGRSSKLDSLGLVNLLIMVEQFFADELDVEISVVSEQAMSRSASPFRSVSTLIEYLCELLDASVRAA